MKNLTDLRSQSREIGGENRRREFDRGIVQLAARVCCG